MLAGPGAKGCVIISGVFMPFTGPDCPGVDSVVAGGGPAVAPALPKEVVELEEVEHEVRFRLEQHRVATRLE